MSDNTNRDMHDSTNINASTDNTIREAFNDLNRRAVMIPTDGGPHKNRTPHFNREPGRRPLVPALAFAAVAAVAAGSVGLWQLQDDDPAVNVATEAEEADNQNGGEDESVASQPADTNGDGAQTDNDESSDDSTSGSEDDESDTTEAADDTATVATVERGDRMRVDTERVAADADDPFLNLRAEPGPGEALVAKLPPNYRGLEATGGTADVDGQKWIEVSLRHHVAFMVPAEIFETPTGWLNSSFTLPNSDEAPIGTDEVPACRGDHELTAASNSGEFHVIGLDSSMLSDDCLRVVVTLAEGSTTFSWAEGPGAYGVPGVAVFDTTFGAHINFDATDSVWPKATDNGSGAYIVRDGDEEQASSVCPRSCLDLRILRSVDSVSTTMLPDLGVVVVDVKLSDTDNYRPDPSVHLTGEPQIEPGAVIVEGIARPFEASVGVEIVDGNGAPVSARYSGGSIGDIEGEQYGVDTTDWTEAWGLFNFRAEGLAPGDYTILLDTDGGSDTPILVEVPFTITE